MKIFILILIMTFGWAGEISIITQNVWFDDETGVKGRYDKLLNELLTKSPDVICLQEVTQAAYKFVQQFAARNSYKVVGEVLSGYGNVTLSKIDIIGSDLIALPSKMGRKALISKIRINGKDVAINNVHLESMMNDTERRIIQISSIIKKNISGQFAIIGDFNFGDGEKENEVLLEYIDVGRGVVGFTYDVDNNSIAKLTMFDDEKSRRLDRIILSKGISGSDYQVLKTSFSDHYGVMVRVK